MTIEFPEEADEAVRKLHLLHPGKTMNTVIVRAMTFYHACYDLHLQGKACSTIDMLIEQLDYQDDEREGK